MGRAGRLDLAACLVDVVDPDAEMLDAVERLLALIAERPSLAGEQGDVDRAVRHVDAAAGLADRLHVERVLEEFLRGFEIRDGNRDMPELGHDESPVGAGRWAMLSAPRKQVNDSRRAAPYPP